MRIIKEKTKEKKRYWWGIKNGKMASFFYILSIDGSSLYKKSRIKFSNISYED